jgi:hypothetical protein
MAPETSSLEAVNVSLRTGKLISLAGTTLAQTPNLAGQILEDSVAEFRDSRGVVKGSVQRRASRLDEDATIELAFRVVSLQGGDLTSIAWLLPGGNTAVGTEYRTDGLGDVGPRSACQTDEELVGRAGQVDITYTFDPPAAGGSSTRFVFIRSAAQEYEKSGKLTLSGVTHDGADWSATVQTFGLQAPQTRPEVVKTTPPLDLGVDVWGLAPLPEGLVAAIGTPHQQQEMQLLLLRPHETGSQLVGNLEFERDLFPRHIVANESLVYVISTREVGTYVVPFLHVVDCREPSQPHVKGSCRCVSGQYFPSSAAYEDGRVYLGTVDHHRGVASIDVRVPETPTPLPLFDGLNLIQPAYLAAADGYLHAGGLMLDANSEHSFRIANAQTMTDGLLFSDMSIPDRDMIGLKAGGNVLLSLRYWQDGVEIFQQDDRGHWPKRWHLTPENYAHAVALHLNPLRVIILSCSPGAVEIWGLDGTGVRLETVAFAPEESPISSPWPSLIVSGGWACFTTVNQFRAIDVSHLLVEWAASGDRQVPIRRRARSAPSIPR